LIRTCVFEDDELYQHSGKAYIPGMKLATKIVLGFLIAISIDLLDSFVNYLLTLRVKTTSEFLLRSDPDPAQPVGGICRRVDRSQEKLSNRSSAIGGL